MPNEQDIDRLKKIILSVNSQNNSSTFSSIDSVHSDIKYAFEVITETSNVPPICSYFSSPDIHNLSSTYEYGNKPPVYNCSHPEIISQTPGAPKFCAFGPRQTICMFYNPDIKLMSSAKVKAFRLSHSSEYTIHLTRYRSYNGSYLYKIYDNKKNVYYDLDYQSEKIDEHLDKEATQVYLDFLTSAFEGFEIQNNVTQQVTDTKKSYLKSLVSSEVN